MALPEFFCSRWDQAAHLSVGQGDTTSRTSHATKILEKCRWLQQLHFPSKTLPRKCWQMLCWELEVVPAREVCAQPSALHWWAPGQPGWGSCASSCCLGQSPPSPKLSQLSALSSAVLEGMHQPWASDMSWSNDGFKFFSKALNLFLPNKRTQWLIICVDTSSAFPAVFNFSFSSHFIILLLFLNFKPPASP